MSVLRMGIEEHIEENNCGKENQAGFTTGGRIENNLLILKYCVEKSFKIKKPLIVISIDFSKAFDSIKRDFLIKTLIDYRINEKVIETITKLYTEDTTKIKIDEASSLTIPVTSGIRQGCTGSTILFKLITFTIIEKLDQLNRGFKDQILNVTSLFFADDGMLLASSVQDAERVVEKVVEAGLECGLEINKQKSNIVVFNMKDKPREIAGIEVKDKIKYLGITVNDSKNLFKTHKQNMIEKATRLSNLTHSVIARSCSRLLIGKAFWKSIALPSILYGANIVEFTKQDIEKLQRLENSVGRKILGAPSYSQGAALRGEIGISSMKARIMGGQLRYLQYILRGEGNELLERVVEEMRASHKKNRWIKGLIEDRKVIGIRGASASNEEINSKVREWDDRVWKQEMAEKESLSLYREWRQRMGGQEKVYDNRESSILLFKSRTNNLNLGDRKRFQNQSTECIMCGAEKEDLIHFLLHCPAYNQKELNILNGSNHTRTMNNI